MIPGGKDIIDQRLDAQNRALRKYESIELGPPLPGNLDLPRNMRNDPRHVGRRM